jgi:hypothetical protein
MNRIKRNNNFRKNYRNPPCSDKNTNKKKVNLYKKSPADMSNGKGLTASLPPFLRHFALEHATPSGAPSLRRPLRSMRTAAATFWHRNGRVATARTRHASATTSRRTQPKTAASSAPPMLAPPPRLLLHGATARTTCLTTPCCRSSCVRNLLALAHQPPRKVACANSRRHLRACRSRRRESEPQRRQPDGEDRWWSRWTAQQRVRETKRPRRQRVGGGAKRRGQQTE